METKQIFLNDDTPRTIVCVKKADGLEVGQKYTMIKIGIIDSGPYVVIAENPGVDYRATYFAEDEDAKIHAVRRWLKDRGRKPKRMCVFTENHIPLLLLGDFYKVYLKNFKRRFEEMKVGDIVVFGSAGPWEKGLCDVSLKRCSRHVNALHFYVLRHQNFFEVYDCSGTGTCVLTCDINLS